ncbi:MAG TPA: ABC-type transport auxiliary lipoprotein family protein [Myxococcales bacterium]|nr:ABC-type transport auxiliary lipoprotein family protein [Myxococcales bacterium]
MSRLPLLLLAVACASTGPRRPERYFVLETRAAAAAPFAVRVAPTTAARFYDTQDIAFSRSPGTRGFYQFNHFTERPQRIVQDALAARLERGGAGTGLLLRTNLDEIFHDAVQAPGAARIALTAQLIDANGAVLATRRFSTAAPAGSYDAEGAARAFAAAIDALADEVVAWIASQRGG